MRFDPHRRRVLLSAPAGGTADEPLVPARGGRRPPSWLREPLLHFVLIGAALFIADHLLVARAGDPRTIVVGPEVDAEARQLFKGSRGVDPTAEQLAALRQAWLDNEVLYREGLALHLEQGDSAIRDRVIFKALNVVEANLRLPPPDVQTLEAWFQAHRDTYDVPARYDFQEAALVGDNTESAVRVLVDELNRNAGGELKAALRVFKGRPHGNLVQSYGEAFAQALEKLPQGQWSALQTPQGWRALRLDAVAPGQTAAFAPLAAVVQQDWTDAVMAEKRTAAVRELARKYRVRFESSGS